MSGRGLLSVTRLGAVALLMSCSTPITGDAALLDAGTSPFDAREGLDARPDATAATDAVLPSDAVGDARLDDGGPRRCREPTPFGPPSLVLGLDSTARDNHSTYSRDELAVVFSSARPPNAGGDDLWAAARARREDPFGGVHRLDALATIQHDSQPTLSSDGLTLIYRQDTATEISLVTTTRGTVATDFPTAAPLAVVNAAAQNEVNPFATGTELYFGREPSDLSTFRDLWRARRLAGSFDAPELVTELNTASQDDCPLLSSDGLTMYFASDRPGGGSRGAYDIWRATRATTGEAFGSIENVSELNTPAEEAPDHLSEDGCRLYLTAVVGGDYGLYVAERSP